jgi:hypothetical protein
MEKRISNNGEQEKEVQGSRGCRYCMCLQRFLPPLPPPPFAPSRTGDEATVRSPLPLPAEPNLPPPSISSYCPFSRDQWRIFMTPSDRRLRVKKNISDSVSKHFLLLQIFDMMSGCRDIDCPKSVILCRRLDFGRHLDFVTF